MRGQKGNWLGVCQIAAELGLAPLKIRRWIESGELRGINVVATLGKRPIYKVSREDLATLLERRACHPTPVPQRKRRRAPEVLDFHPMKKTAKAAVLGGPCFGASHRNST